MIETCAQAHWRAFTPAQVLELLKSAPKVAGPVEQHPFLGPTRGAVYVVVDSVISTSDEKLKKLGWLLVESQMFKSIERAARSSALPLMRCASDRDGDCTHTECPQNRDNEPNQTGRHCPLDTWEEDD